MLEIEDELCCYQGDLQGIVGLGHDCLKEILFSICNLQIYMVINATYAQTEGQCTLKFNLT